MPDTKYVSKVIYGGKTLMDLTGDTVTADKLLKDVTAHDKSGTPIIGACPFDVDSTDADALVAEIMLGKTAYARGAKLVGTMPNRAGEGGVIASKEQEVTIAQGYHDGSGKVGLDAVEKNKIIPGNIKQGITVLGVEGTCEPSSAVTAQAKEVTPGTAQQVVLPDVGIDYLSQVTVLAIPYVESDNAAGGKTVTIAG